MTKRPFIQGLFTATINASVLLLLAATSPALAGEQPGASAAAPDSRSAAATVRDEVADGLLALGIVSLVGTVPEKERRLEAVEIAAKTTGTKKVVNLLKEG